MRLPTRTVLLSVVATSIIFFHTASTADAVKFSRSPIATATLQATKRTTKQLRNIELATNKIPYPDNPVDQRTESSSPSLAPLHATIFLMVAGSGLVAFSPAPALIERLGTDVAARTLSILSATAALFEIAFSPTIGSFMDAVGRKPVLVSAILPVMIANAVVAMRPSSVASICISKVVASVGGSLVFLTSQAILSDMTAGSSGEKMSAAMGVQMSLLSLGFLCGAIAAGRVGEYGLRITYGTSTAVLSLAAIMALSMKETLLPAPTLTRKEHHALEETRMKEKALRSWFSPLVSCLRIFRHKNKNIRRLVILMMLSNFPQYMGDVFQIFSRTEWNLGPKDFSSFVALFGVIGIVGNVVGSVLVKHIGIPHLTMMATFSSMFVPVGITLFKYRGAVFGALIGFLSATQGLSITAALVAEGRKSGIPQGELAGERSSILALLKVIGPIWYSLLYVQGGKRLGVISLPFVFNIGLGAIAFGLSLSYLAK
jgi:MFS family permease